MTRDVERRGEDTNLLRSDATAIIMAVVTRRRRYVSQPCTQPRPEPGPRFNWCPLIVNYQWYPTRGNLT